MGCAHCGSWSRGESRGRRAAELKEETGLLGSVLRKVGESFFV
ncbi:hypothetical protein [Streptomyces sp. KL116D]